MIHYKYVIFLALVAALVTVFRLGKTIGLMYCNDVLYQNNRDWVRFIKAQVNREINGMI